MRYAWILSVALLLLGVAGGPISAEEQSQNAKARKKLDPDPVVVEVDDEEAKELLDAIEDAEDEGSAHVKAIAALITKRHEDFVKPLLKLARDRDADVREVATRALGSQENVRKIGPKLLSYLLWKPNRDDPGVIAASISSLRRLKYEHPKVTKELIGHFRKVKDAGVMKECARYFGDLKVKDAFEPLLYWVEAPQPGNVNSDTNPPASYWRRMWEVWDAIKEAVWCALEDLTGKDFHTDREWKEWRDTREAKELGFD